MVQRSAFLSSFTLFHKKREVFFLHTSINLSLIKSNLFRECGAVTAVRIRLKVVPLSVVNVDEAVRYLSAKLDWCYFLQEPIINCYFSVGVLWTVTEKINPLTLSPLTWKIW